MRVNCRRCERSFRNFGAYRQHTIHSQHHNQCPECVFDGSNWQILLDHFRHDGCRTVCQGCNNGDGDTFVNGSQEYWEHVAIENVCTTCERHFNTVHNLSAHMLTHRPAIYGCFGCDRSFTTYGGMLIHLEEGVCNSGIDMLDINFTAAKCYSWSQYINPNERRAMLLNVDFRDLHEYNYQAFPYKCPTCQNVYSRLSSLFQHIESTCCPQTLNRGGIGKLKHFLRKQLKRAY